MKNIYLLGATGSIGMQTLDIIRANKDKFRLVGISVGNNIELAQKIIMEFNPEIVCFKNQNDYEKIGYKGEFFYGDEGLNEIASHGNSENALLVNALVGAVGLTPTVKAIKSHKNIALANKETLVMAGDIINDLIKENNVKLYPIDSEHSAIWQCLNGEDICAVKRLIITASGGAFRDKSREQLKSVNVKDALNHPNWKMGPKITIDSATMMNKGFEVIEAHYLFAIPYSKIDTIMHKKSIVHSLVEFEDGSIKAVFGTPDMHIPIFYALDYPNHNHISSEYLDLIKMGTIDFSELSTKRYPCLEYAYYAGNKGGLYPTVLNAANEAAVKLFLKEKISFLEIEEIIADYLNKEYNDDFNLENIIALNQEIQTKILNKYGVE